MAEQFCLRWNNHQNTLASIFHTLWGGQELVDCSLAAEGHCVKAHRILLSACSPYFQALLREHPDKHPIFILKDVTFKELTALMDYMYKGEVNISQDELGALLKVAENLKIKGLSDSAEKTEERTAERVAVPPPPAQQISAKTRSSVPIERCSPNIEKNDLLADHLSASADVPGPRKRKRARRQSSEEAALGQNQTSLESVSFTLSEPSSHVIQSLPSHDAATTMSSKANAVIPETRTVRERPPPDVTVPKTEPTIEQVLVPKQEFDDTENDNYEDLTLDDDDYNDDDDDMDNSQPGPSQGNDGLSNQGFSPWQTNADGSMSDSMIQAQDVAGGTGQGRRVSWPLDDVREGEAQAVLRFRCLACKRSFKYKGNLTYHMKHECGKDLRCPNCNKRFKQKPNLVSHMKNECGKELKCLSCNKKYNLMRGLIRHIKNGCGANLPFPFPLGVNFKSEVSDWR